MSTVIFDEFYSAHQHYIYHETGFLELKMTIVLIKIDMSDPFEAYIVQILIVLVTNEVRKIFF
jgi:hypothetical protein